MPSGVGSPERIMIDFGVDFLGRFLSARLILGLMLTPPLGTPLISSTFRQGRGILLPTGVAKGNFICVPSRFWSSVFCSAPPYAVLFCSALICSALRYPPLWVARSGRCTRAVSVWYT